MRDIEAEMHKTLDALDDTMTQARLQAQRQFRPVRIEKALDATGRPIIADMLCAKANLLIALRDIDQGRGEQGDSGLVGALVSIIVIAALGQLLGLDVIGAFGTAVTWTADLISDLAGTLGDG